LQQLGSFTLWLPKHAAIVNSIAVDVQVASKDEVYPFACNRQESPLTEAAQQFKQALETAVLSSTIAATARTEGPAEASIPLASVHHTVLRGTQQQQQQQQQQLGLCLVSFSSNLPDALGMLSVLPASRLTRLDLQL
jgi:hypothetical protein